MIDCWHHLQDPLELAAKKQIHNLLDLIQGRETWQIYVWNGQEPMDQSIARQLIDGNFSVALDFDDPLTLYNCYLFDGLSRYYYCGFHTNQCLFYNTVGIEKYLQIADKSRSQFWIVQDATVAMTLEYDLCRPQDIPWYSPTQGDESTINLMNYRNHIISTSMIESKDIQIH